MVSKSTVRTPYFFLELGLPNEEAPEICISLDILRWSANRDERPEVYVHTLLKNKNLSRVRWNNAASLGVTREVLERDNQDLPSIEDMKEVNYLKSKRVIVFEMQDTEPWVSLLSSASIVISIKDLWKEVYADSEKAMACNTLPKMLEYLHLPKDDTENKQYTPLQLRLHAIAAIWYLLTTYKAHPEEKKIRDGFALNQIWPVQSVDDEWFPGEPKVLAQISPVAARNFFSHSIYDHIDWYSQYIYAHDWVFKRKNSYKENLRGQVEMADFVFNNVLDLNMQLWVLVYYSIFARRTNFALEIVLKKGVFSSLLDHVRDDFSKFLIRHLEDFLSDNQKYRLVRSIMRQSIDDRSRCSYTDYNYNKLSTSDSPAVAQYSFRTVKVKGTGVKCFWEIRGRKGEILYRRYEISGIDDERQLCIDEVNKLFRIFLEEIRHPFSIFWVREPEQGWIQYITGQSWPELKMVPRASDSKLLKYTRQIISNIIIEESMPSIQNLKDTLKEIIEEINSYSGGKEDTVKRFTFLDTSIEVCVTRRTHTSLLKRLLRLH